MPQHQLPSHLVPKEQGLGQFPTHVLGPESLGRPEEPHGNSEAPKAAAWSGPGFNTPRATAWLSSSQASWASRLSPSKGLGLPRPRLIQVAAPGRPPPTLAELGQDLDLQWPMCLSTHWGRADWTLETKSNLISVPHCGDFGQGLLP